MATATEVGHDFTAVYEAHWKPTYGLCVSMLRSRDEAEDAAQDTMLRAYTRMLGGQEPREVRPWLFAIARNLCVDRIRQRERAGEVELSEATAARAGAGGGGALAATVEGPEEALERRARLDVLISDLRALSSAQRRALVLRELSGISHREIAEAIGTTPARSRSLVSEARQVLNERAAGRELPCADYRRLTEGRPGRPRSHRLQAHVESCLRCGAPASPRDARQSRQAGLQVAA